jgi:hypothetical protein
MKVKKQYVPCKVNLTIKVELALIRGWHRFYELKGLRFSVLFVLSFPAAFS